MLLGPDEPLREKELLKCSAHANIKKRIYTGRLAGPRIKLLELFTDSIKLDVSM